MNEERTADVFRSFLVEEAEYAGQAELPMIKTSDELPQKLIPFSRAVAKNRKDFDGWICFYEQDRRFERLWKDPKRYLPIIKKFKGVISPDFSLYRNMPICMQLWNAYRGRALANWLQKNGVEVIPNVRFGDERSYSFCFDGIEPEKTIAVGTHGCIKQKADRLFFQVGLNVAVRRLRPKTIVVYGRAPDRIFKPYRDQGIRIIPFESEFATSRKKVRE